MSWLGRLADELTTRLVTGREQRRIVLELRDHIDCERGCEARLGDPRQLAVEFADQLATDARAARRSRGSGRWRALVAGTLAALRALRRRGRGSCPPLSWP